MKLKIFIDVLSSILSTIGSYPPETGGVIGIRNSIICDFFYDADAKVGRGFYEPSGAVETIIRQWAQNGVTFAGFVHSHLKCYTPTATDIEYSLKVFRWYASQIDLVKVQTIGIVESSDEEGQSKLHLFAVTHNALEPVEIALDISERI